MPRTALLAIGSALFLALLAGCGGGAGGGDDAVALSRWLPAGADSYTAVDLTAFREGLDLPEDADATGRELAPYSGPALAPVFAARDRKVLSALEPGALTAIASDGEVSAMATTADTGEIGSALGDLGFTDEGGVLVYGDLGSGSGGRESVAFRLDDGLIFAATDPAALRSLPKEPAEKAPSPLLNDFDAPYVFIAGVPGPGCIRAQVATAQPGGDGEIAWLVDGGASSDAVESQGSGAIEVGEPEVDGDLVTVPVSYADEGTGGGIASREALGSSQVSYVC